MARAKPAGNFLEDFQEATGTTIDHGSIAITPMMGDVYNGLFGDVPAQVASDALAKQMKFHPRLVNPSLVFHIVFGVSVKDVSYNAVANLDYEQVVWGDPVSQDDVLYVTSEVLGTAARRNEANSGSVKVHTVARNQYEHLVLEFVRTVLVNVANPDAMRQHENFTPYDAAQHATCIWMPGTFSPLEERLAAPASAFDEFVEGNTYQGLSQNQISSIDAGVLTALTQNIAAVHHDPAAGNILYGGTVISTAIAQLMGHMPSAWPLEVISGRHSGPTYPANIVSLDAAARPEDAGLHERISSSMRVVAKEPINDSWGRLVVDIAASKDVTPASKAFLNRYAPRMHENVQENNKLPVLELRMAFAVPTLATYAR